MPTITVSDETYRRLSARAAAQGVTLEEAIELPAVPEPAADDAAPPGPPANGEPDLIDGMDPLDLPPMTPDTPLEERVRRFNAMTRWIESRPRKLLPGYRADDSRDAIYSDDPDPE